MTDFDRSVELIKLWRELMRNEEALISQRITWLLGVNGFLVASFVILGTYRNVQTPSIELEMVLTSSILTTVGFVIALYCWGPIIDALDTIDIIRKKLNRFRTDPQFSDVFYKSRGEKFHYKSWVYARRLPIILCVMWLALFGSRLSSIYFQ